MIIMRTSPSLKSAKVCYRKARCIVHHYNMTLIFIYILNFFQCTFYTSDLHRSLLNEQNYNSRMLSIASIFFIFAQNKRINVWNWIVLLHTEIPIPSYYFLRISIYRWLKNTHIFLSTLMTTSWNEFLQVKDFKEFTNSLTKKKVKLSKRTRTIKG